MLDPYAPPWPVISTPERMKSMPDIPTMAEGGVPGVNLVFWFGVFVLLQAGRLWVLATLGPRWTTRIIVLPGAPLVAKGPYRFVSHPNYLVVIGEIAVLPLCFGLWWFAIIFSIANAVILTIRIRAEAAALAGTPP